MGDVMIRGEESLGFELACDVVSFHLRAQRDVLQMDWGQNRHRFLKLLAVSTSYAH